MEITQIVTQWVGLAIGLIMALTILAWAFGCAVDKVAAVFNKYMGRRLDSYMRELGIRMEGEAYWFSTAEQMAMWKACADSLRYGNRPDASQVRDHVYPRKLAEVKEKFPQVPSIGANK